MGLIVSLEPIQVPPRRVQAPPASDRHRPGLGAGEGCPVGLTSGLKAEGWVGVRRAEWKSMPSREHSLGGSLALTGVRDSGAAGAGAWGRRELRGKVPGMRAVPYFGTRATVISPLSLLSSEHTGERA